MFKTQILHNNEVIDGRFEDLGGRHTTVWLDVSDPDQRELALVAAHIKTGPEELSQLMQKNQRPVLHDIGQFTAVVFHAPQVKNQTVVIRPHLLLASKEQKDFIGLHDGDSIAASKINTYSLRRKTELFQKGSTALLYAALDEIVAAGFDVLDYASEEISKLEEQVFHYKTSVQVMKKIFNLKKNLIYVQRVLAADREVVSGIEKAYGQFLDQKQLANFRLLYSDITQLIELAATYRDIIISTVEVHLATISNNLNVVMKKLTAWAAIILVPSLIAGIYGMNFAVLPLSQNPAGFWLMIALMLASVGLLYSYFKHNDWI